MSTINIDPVVLISNKQQLSKVRTDICPWILCASFVVSVPQVSPAICLCIQNSLRLAQHHLTLWLTLTHLTE